MVKRPESMSAPSATVPNEKRFRSGPAESEHRKTPTPPAAKRRPISPSAARRSCFAKRTSWAKTVVEMRLMSAIISEMFRNTGCASTYRRPSAMSCRMVVARGATGALNDRRMSESAIADTRNDAAST